MSQYAKQAIAQAAAADAELKSRLQDEASFEAAVAEVLALTDAEKQEVMEMMSAEDMDAPAMEEAEERNNPGPGVGSM